MALVTAFQKKKMTDKPQHNDQLLAEALPEGVVFLNSDCCITGCNEIAKDLLGFEMGSYLQRHLSEVLDKKLFLRLEIESSLEVTLAHKPSQYLLMNLRPYAGDQFSLLVRDVTLTHNLESMRKVFVANVSHELRTPLTVFQGYLELLKDASDLTKAQLTEIIEHMDSQATRMHQLVEDLLLLSRLENVEPDPERQQAVPVASMLRNIRDDAVSLSGKKQHTFILELDETLTLVADPEELRSAFSNLVYNAVHYTPAGGNITIRWYTQGNEKYMEVEDTGIGIDTKHIPRVTQRFYRVDKARSSAAGGTGLGLALVKHVLLRHHGDLEIESELGKGSLFRCIF